MIQESEYISAEQTKGINNYDFRQNQNTFFLHFHNHHTLSQFNSHFSCCRSKRFGSLNRWVAVHGRELGR